MATTVKYYNGANLIGEGTVAPDYAFSWTTAPAGNPVITAKRFVDGVEQESSSAVNVVVNAASGYSAESQAVFANMATDPATPYKDAMNTAINSLVTAGIWSKIDELQYAGLDTLANSLRGWKGVVNATTNGVHAPKTGLTYNGTDQFSGTGFIPSVNGVNYTSNSAFMGVYVRSGTYPASEKHLMGVRDTISGTRTWLNLDAAGTLTHRINGAAALVHTPETTGFGSNNLWINRRKDSGNIALHKNGTIVSTGAAVVGGLSAREIYEAALNYEGFGASYPLACTTVLRIFGGGLTDAQITTLSTTLNQLVTNIDAIA